MTWGETGNLARRAPNAADIPGQRRLFIDAAQSARLFSPKAPYASWPIPISRANHTPPDSLPPLLR
ncbi:protein of unknown function [Burkholderia multivorans]